MNAPAALPAGQADLVALIRRELSDIRPQKLAGEWSDAARFIDDLGLDSLDLVELVARLEQSTGLYVPDEDLKLLTSVADTAAYVRSRQTDNA